MAEDNSILRIHDLSVAFQSKDNVQTVLKNLSLSLSRGQCVGLVGESGSGKTMTALSILQLLPHNALVSQKSRIIFREKNLLDLFEKHMRHIRGKHISMIFQDAMSALNPVLTVGHQLQETLRLHYRMRSSVAKQRALDLLSSVGIADPAHCYQSYPHQLSGGMQQRAMIAIAIAAEPEIIIADEPTTALDVTLQAQILDLLLRFKKEKGCALLFIGHDLSVVKKVADEIVVLKKGELVETASTKNFFQNPVSEYGKELLRALLPNTTRQVAIDLVGRDRILQVDRLKTAFPIRQGILKRITGYVKAVDDVSFHVHRGETLALVGESGSGKTTTAKSILQLLRVTEGRVLFENQLLSQLKSRDLRRLRADMQIIFQDPFSALNPRMLVSESLFEGLFVQKRVATRKAALTIIDGLLREVDLPLDVKSRYPHELSGGQRQRICIARALTLSPKLLILDEPTSALDVSIQKQILDLLDHLQQEKQLAYLLITHNLSVVAYLAHRVAIMHQGKIVETGFTRDVLTSPAHDYTKRLFMDVKYHRAVYE